jgi:hypothetical protein
LTVSGSSSNRFRADGGSGRDTYNDDGTSISDEEQVVNFEVRNDVLPG